MAAKKRWQATGFAGRLQALRERAGLTQTQLAERASCAMMTISKLERGVQEPAWPFVLILADALGVSVEEFREVTAPPPPSPPPLRGVEEVLDTHFPKRRKSPAKPAKKRKG